MDSEAIKLEQQLANLALKYTCRTNRKVTSFTDANGAQVDIVRQARDYGQAAYYAVIDGEPVAYVVGHHIDRHRNDDNDIIRYRRRPRFIVTSLFVAPARRGIGIATGLYSAIIKSGVVLVSDWDRNNGSEALWSSLQQHLPRRTVAYFSGLYIGRFPRLN